jgi:hypothetical protein
MSYIRFCGDALGGCTKVFLDKGLLILRVEVTLYPAYFRKKRGNQRGTAAGFCCRVHRDGKERVRGSAVALGHMAGGKLPGMIVRA